MKTQELRYIIFDAETFYDTEYSLSKITTAEYVSDPRFQFIGGAISIDFAYPTWHVGRIGLLPVLQSLELGRPGTVFVAHNALFDGSCVEWQLGIKPWKYFCTMMGARPYMVPKNRGARMSLASLAHFTDAGDKTGYVVKAKGKRLEDFTSQELSDYGDYCIQDTAICAKLALRQLQQIPLEERDLLDLTIKKFTRPRLRLNGHVLDAELARVKQAKADLLSKAVLPSAVDLRSNAKFVDLLKANGLKDFEVPKKTSPITGKETFALAKTDPGFKALLEHPDERIQTLCTARVGHRSTQLETRLQRFIDVAAAMKFFPVPLLWWGALTGRFSGLDKINLQNLKRKSALRKAIVAPKGHEIVVGDLAQIEARVLAALAGEKALLQRFARKEDVYKAFGAEIVFRTTHDLITAAQRFISKTAILGLGYGLGPQKFHEALEAAEGTLSPEVAKQVHNLNTLKFAKGVVYAYRDAHQKIETLWLRAGSWLDIIKTPGAVPVRYGPLFIAPGFIGMPNGTSIQYTDVAVNEEGDLMHGPEGKRRRIYGPKLVENVTQALARIILTDAERFLASRGWPSCLSVHDELVYVCHVRNAEKFKLVLEKTLTRPVPWMPHLPLEAEVGSGDNYADAK